MVQGSTYFCTKLSNKIQQQIILPTSTFLATPALAALPPSCATGAPTSDSVSCSGYCKFCRKTHHIYAGAAIRHCLKLMNLLEEKKRIDFSVTDETADPRFSTDYLFGEARGQMFGVMVYRDQNGSVGSIPAFSCQYNGSWLVDGWVPPLFDVKLFHDITFPVEKEIKKMGREIDFLKKGSLAQNTIIHQRKTLSRKLMKKIHALYSFTNFRGETASIRQAFTGPNGIPTGTGDCCAPKLLNYAAGNNLTPLSIAEFYWGRENKSKTRRHGLFYSSCQEKCSPILGFLLCGLHDVSCEHI
jgi:hypothetical protein